MGNMLLHKRYQYLVKRFSTTFSKQDKPVSRCLFFLLWSIARDCVTLTKPSLPSTLNARFLGTPPESVRHDPRNACANFGACTQKCAKRPFLTLSHRTNTRTAGWRIIWKKIIAVKDATLFLVHKSWQNKLMRRFY